MLKRLKLWFKVSDAEISDPTPMCPLTADVERILKVKVMSLHFLPMPAVDGHWYSMIAVTLPKAHPCCGENCPVMGRRGERWTLMVSGGHHRGNRLETVSFNLLCPTCAEQTAVHQNRARDCAAEGADDPHECALQKGREEDFFRS